MPKLISIWEVAADLGYTDLRRLKKWCLRYSVGIVRFSGSNKMFVWDVEYEQAKASALIEYGSENYTLSGNSFTQSLIQLSIQDSYRKIGNYKPSGEIESSVLSRLQNI